jgi:hypothetical protein
LTSFGQVTFELCPSDNQLYGRDLSTNLGQVRIKGFAKTVPVQYDSLHVNILRNGQQIESVQYELNYINDTAFFDLTYNVLAELANYSFVIQGCENGNMTTIREVHDVVAGDAFIISGQSNAEAKSRDQNTASIQHDFVRVYKSGVPYPSALINNDNWYIAQGDGDRFSNGNVGQWGLQFAHRLVNELQVPVALFNGAHPAQPISFFQAPVDYNTSLNSNYGRLYHRIDKGNLKSNIRAVFWSQGEKNGLPLYSLTSNEYKNEFRQLKQSWLYDYPNIEHFYLFQTSNGCDKPLENIMEIKEGQRQLGLEDDNVTTIPTNALIQFEDSCHYNFINGYKEFGNRLYDRVRSDIYGVAKNSLLPSPTEAIYIGKKTVIIEINSPGLWISGDVPEFAIEDGHNEIISVSVSGSQIFLELLNVPLPSAVISYYGPQEATTSHHIRNGDNIELLSFSKLPVDVGQLNTDNLTEGSFILYPNPVEETLFIEGLTADQTCRLFDLTGKPLLTVDNFAGGIDVRDLQSGIYLIQIGSDRNNSIKLYKK